MDITTSKQIMKEDKGNIQVGEQQEDILATQKGAKNSIYTFSYCIGCLHRVALSVQISELGSKEISSLENSILTTTTKYRQINTIQDKIDENSC